MSRLRPRPRLSCEAELRHPRPHFAEDGQLWGSGCNTDGQLGLGAGALEDMHQFTQVELPEQIGREGGVAELRAGADTSAVVTKAGTVWSWGNSVRTAHNPIRSLNTKLTLNRWPNTGVRSGDARPQD